jgi:L-ascorbate metabolism protein UlaG (beta-lactamase superfamily)
MMTRPAAADVAVRIAGGGTAGRRNGRFVNPEGSAHKSLRDLLRWWTDGAKTPWPRHLVDPAYPPPEAVARGTIAATFIGHATFLLQVGGLRLLTDPVFSEHAGPFGRIGPRRVRPPGVALAQLPRIDVVLLSHNHYDHLDLPALRALRDRCDPLIVTGLGNRRFLEARGLRRVEELDWWQSIAGPGGSRLTFVPARHFSGRGLLDRDRTLWGGFIVERAPATLYFAGDSGYFSGFREIGARFGPIDLALLPIGAYAPRWFMQAAHIDPDEAVQAHLDLRARLSLAMHFGTFRLSNEGIEAPVLGLRKALERRGVAADRFRVLGFGETLPIAAVPGHAADATSRETAVGANRLALG